jgi:hypothetical protein
MTAQIPNHQGDTPLLWAARTGNPDIIETLLQHNAAMQSNRDRVNVLMCLASNSNLPDMTRSLDLLLACRDCPEMDERDVYGRTALHYAAESGNLVCVQRFLELGADASAIDCARVSALEKANQSPQVQKLIRDKMNQLEESRQNLVEQILLEEESFAQQELPKTKKSKKKLRRRSRLKETVQAKSRVPHSDRSRDSAKSRGNQMDSVSSLLGSQSVTELQECAEIDCIPERIELSPRDSVSLSFSDQLSSLADSDPTLTDYVPEAEALDLKIGHFLGFELEELSETQMSTVEEHVRKALFSIESFKAQRQRDLNLKMESEILELKTILGILSAQGKI